MNPKTTSIKNSASQFFKKVSFLFNPNTSHPFLSALWLLALLFPFAGRAEGSESACVVGSQDSEDSAEESEEGDDTAETISEETVDSAETVGPD
jgi:hypothetical protein